MKIHLSFKEEKLYFMMRNRRKFGKFLKGFQGRDRDKAEKIKD